MNHATRQPAPPFRHGIIRNRPRTHHSVSSALMLLVLSGSSAMGQLVPAPPASADRPALVVVLVVDQLRYDLMHRYEDLYTGGLRRLLDGAAVTAATHDHGITETSPGHATLATGTYPSRHGIVANQWFDSSKGAWTYAVEDPSTRLTGTRFEGSSPHFLLRGGLADWLRAADPDSRTASVSAKDRAAILIGGRGTGPVMWFEPAVGEFVTSTFYADEVPGWLAEFNAAHRDAWAADSVWTSRLPPSATVRTRPDTSSFEGDGVHTSFPHRFHEEGSMGSLAGEGLGETSGFFDWFATTPSLDEAVLDLAVATVLAEHLGQDAHTDLLSISLSQTDRVGHAYGPLSREQMDTLLRLDAALGDFFGFLDETVNGGWLLGMSADHGVSNIPELDARSDEGVQERLKPEERVEMLRGIVDALENRREGAPARVVAEAAARSPYVHRAWVLGEAAAEEDSLGIFMQRSFLAGRPGRIEGRFGIAVAF
ncbi:MAG: hypothetical protein HKO53_15685, partial [Gemmatimonadetes bacterium]|nr:hypothetical protein [Gemmatimonadota bacterium]